MKNIEIPSNNFCPFCKIWYSGYHTCPHLVQDGPIEVRLYCINASKIEVENKLSQKANNYIDNNMIQRGGNKIKAAGSKLKELGSSLKYKFKSSGDWD